jgi:hypothetical protein
VCWTSHVPSRSATGTTSGWWRSAYLVDAETAELHPSLPEGQRGYDLSLARERIAGELFDLAAAGTLPGPGPARRVQPTGSSWTLLGRQPWWSLPGARPSRRTRWSVP